MSSTACCDQYADENGKHQWPFSVKGAADVVKKKKQAKLRLASFSMPLTHTDLVAYGEIYEDEAKRFENGRYIRTSYVVKYDKEAGILETRNTIYHLI